MSCRHRSQESFFEVENNNIVYRAASKQSTAQSSSFITKGTTFVKKLHGWHGSTVNVIV